MGIARRAAIPILILAACAPPRGAPAPTRGVSPFATVGAATARTAAEAHGTDAAVPRANTAESDLTRPCPEGSSELAAASAALDALDAEMAKLSPEGDGAAVTKRLADLRTSPCFALVEVEDVDTMSIAFDSALSATTWWKNGGEAWLREQLELGVKTPHDENHPRWSWVPPTPRTTLTKEHAKGSPIATLLCPAADAECGRETRGWMRRADLAYAGHAASQRNAPREHDRREVCTKKALAEPRERRWSAWRSCLHEQREIGDAPPLGSFRAPTEGWLVVRGRRGHYHFCDEIRAYDLATGAAWTNGTCSALVLREGGSVDAAKTDAARVPKTEVSRLPLENLREAALATLLAPHVQQRVLRQGFGLAMPDGVEPISDRAVTMGLGFGGSWSSAQTTLHWAWVVGGRAVASGELTWPEDMNSAASDHAVKLLQIAEAATSPIGAGACVPAAPPSPLPLGDGKPRVAAIDGAVDRAVTGATTRVFEGAKVQICAPVRAASR